MNRLLLLLMMLGCLTTQAQISKERKISLADGSVLHYLSVQDKFNGLYLIQKDDTDLARGNYVDGKRVGNWYFFSYNKELALRYNYDSRKVLFVDNKLLSVANVSIKTDDNEVKSQASIPLPVLSLQQYYYLATAAAKAALPPEDLNLIDKESVVVVAAISKEGKATYSVRYALKGKEPQVRSFTIAKAPFDVEWIPASSNGKNYEAEFAFKADLSVKTDNVSGHKRFSWM